MNCNHVTYEKPTLSPQIVLRAHVRTLWTILMDAFQVSEAVRSRIYRDLRRSSGIRVPGIWKRNDVDLKR